MMTEGGKPFLRFALCLLPFILLATLNSAGYRYGASDQAFYVPSIVEHLHPEFFTRDHPVLAAQARFMISDDVFFAWFSRFCRGTSCAEATRRRERCFLRLR